MGVSIVGKGDLQKGKEFREEREREGKISHTWIRRHSCAV